MNEDLKESIIETMLSLHQRIGDTVLVEDWLCTSGRSYDRHQTRYGKIILKIDEFRIRTSGAIATMGNDSQRIEFSTGAIKQIDKKEGELTLELKISEKIWRRIKISENQPNLH